MTRTMVVDGIESRRGGLGWTSPIIELYDGSSAHNCPGVTTESLRAGDGPYAAEAKGLLALERH